MSTQVQEKTNAIQANIPLAFARYLQDRQEERVLEVVVVYNGDDRWDTIIDPRGMETDPSIVTVDYNHRGTDTGAYISNLRVEKNYGVEGIDGEKQVLEEVLVAELHIPKTAEMFYFNSEGEKKSNGNLYDAVTKGHIKSVSVRFDPKKQYTNTKTGITTFRTWDLISLSVLDIPPGQPYSGVKIIRYFDASNQNSNSINNKTRAMPKAIHNAINKKVQEKFGDEKANVADLKLLATFEYADQTHQIEVDYEESEDGKITDVKLGDIEALDERGYGGDEKKMREMMREEMEKRVKPLEDRMGKVEAHLKPGDKREGEDGESESQTDSSDGGEQGSEKQEGENKDEKSEEQRELEEIENTKKQSQQESSEDRSGEVDNSFTTQAHAVSERADVQSSSSISKEEYYNFLAKAKAARTSQL